MIIIKICLLKVLKKTVTNTVRRFGDNSFISFCVLTRQTLVLTSSRELSFSRAHETKARAHELT